MRMSPLFEAEVAGIEAMPGAGTVRLRGRVTFDEAPEVRKVLLGAVGKHAGSKLVLELGGVDEIDTSGAAVLAESAEGGHQPGAACAAVQPQ